jgi:putative spermidine/putrescine transport system permease protein
VEEQRQLTATAGARAGAFGMRRTVFDTIGVWPLLVALAVLFFLPAWSVISASWTEPAGAGLSNYVKVLTDPTFGRFVANTVRTAVIVSAVTAILGYVYAYGMYRCGPVMRAVLMNCALLPLWTSLLVRSFAWTVILRDTGIVNWLLIDLGLITEPLALIRTPFAVTIGMAQILLPFAILPVYASMTKFQPGLLLAARSLGARPGRAFWEVFFPATRPGLLAGLVLVFILSLGYYITPILLGGPGDQPVAVLIDAQVTRQLDWGLAGAMSGIVTLAVLLLLAVGWRTISRLFLT